MSWQQFYFNNPDWLCVSDSALREDQSEGSPWQHHRQPQQARRGQTERRSGNQHGLQGPQESDQRPQREHLPGPDRPADRGRDDESEQPRGSEVQNRLNSVVPLCFVLQHLNKTFNADVPLVLMNSFNTDDDTKKILQKYKHHRVNIHTFNQSRWHTHTHTHTHTHLSDLLVLVGCVSIKRTQAALWCYKLYLCYCFYPRDVSVSVTDSKCKFSLPDKIN